MTLYDFVQYVFIAMVLIVGLMAVYGDAKQKRSRQEAEKR